MSRGPLAPLQRAPVDLLTAVGAGLLALLMWGGACAGFFIKDDFVWLRCAAETTVNLGNVFNLSVANFLRPVPHLLFAALYGAGGADPALFHWAGLTAHVLCAVLLGRLTRQLSGSRSVGALCAALFMLNPIVDEVVIWIAALNESIHALALLATLLAWSRLVRDDARRPPVYAAALLALLVTLGSKETGVVAVPLMALSHLGLRQAGRARALSLLAYLPPALLLLGYLLVQAFVQHDAAAITRGAYVVEPAALARLVVCLGLLFASAWPPLAAAALGLLTPGNREPGGGRSVLATIANRSRLTSAQLRVGLLLLAAAALVLLPYAPFRHQSQASRYFYLPAMIAALLGALALRRLLDARPHRLSHLLLALTLTGAAIFGLRDARREVTRYLRAAAQTERFVRAAARLPTAADGLLSITGGPLEGQHLSSMLFLFHPAQPRVRAGGRRWDAARRRFIPPP